MSIAFYNQKWETAIGQLLDNVQEENFPLEENKEKGVHVFLCRSVISVQIMNGSHIMVDFIFAILMGIVL